MKLLDLFSGIGGFHKGFTQAGFKFDWVGFSEIDKYASAVYKHRFKKSEELGDITAIQSGARLPNHIDILCAGFPCQAFSIAGRRQGFDDTRGTLFFEIARILRHYRDVGQPISCFVLENVKGLLSHDNGRTFATIYRVLTNLGYTIECQLLNTRWWLPQNRERIYIVGHIGNGSGSKVFPFGEDDKVYNNNSSRTKSKTKFCGAITTGEGHRRESNFVKVKKLNQIGTIGKDSEATRATYCIDSMNLQAIESDYHIRRLTPTECERLQGFPDGWTSEGVIDGKVVPMSDTQRYKQCGNAVTVDVVEAVARKIKKIL